MNKEIAYLWFVRGVEFYYCDVIGNNTYISDSFGEDKAFEEVWEEMQQAKKKRTQEQHKYEQIERESKKEIDLFRINKKCAKPLYKNRCGVESIGIIEGMSYCKKHFEQMKLREKKWI